MKKVTVKDIAEMSGYSVSTISKALNGTDRVSMETIAKIKQIAEQCGYRSSFSAQSLARKTRKIAIVLYNEPREIRTMFEEGFASAFDLYGEFGIEPVYYYFDTDDIPNLSCVPWDKIGDECDALIMTPSNRNVDFHTCVETLDQIGKKIPIVSLLMKHECLSDITHMASVTVNAKVVGALAAQFIAVSNRTTTGKTAIITGYKNEWIHHENIKSFISTGNRFGFETVAVEESFNEMDKAYSETKKILTEHKDISGLFATSYVSPAICEALCDMGRQDITIVGVDLGKDAVRYMKAGILDAAIFQNQKQQAETSVEYVVNYFRGTMVASDVYVKPELVLLSNLPCYGWI